ncbi:MAG: transporter substrate-binding domain-containing protein [Mesorhizobium sp.]|uniref:transporter substrate-binding domain-containing protein n=1 Tax=Mesorhizobium sp. TaxID=1871066 RepID=UPI001218CE70|nr:transporter substrate-binding domain-containing protein [Mesorhizobium sp.]TIO04642.1 MAG: transporter substrate-binding domain-containing protein [Mesorhizobium sp.]TIP09083.1 MAG: transporter substrate-binding domain-containing protein [Mesorhizobium sp.]
MKAFASPFVAAAAALVVALLAPPAAAQATDAENQLDAVVKNGRLRVCTTGDYKPFTFRDKVANSYQGIDIDLAKSLASSLGVEAEFVETTWKTLLADFTAGKCDIAMGGISVTLERQKQVFFSEPYLVNGKAPIARCEDEARFQTIADIDKPNVTVIVNPGGTNEKFVREKLSDAKIEIYPDNVTIFQQILDGKADIMIAESVETELQEKLHPGLCAINPDKPLQYGEMGYMLPEGAVVFKAYVDQWVHLAKATGEFDRIYDSHVK